MCSAYLLECSKLRAMPAPARPVGGVTYPRTYQEFRAWFPDDAACREYLGKSYETAWAWLHKLRRAMVRPDRELLGGVVELDQSFVGGRATGKRGPSSDKAPITIAVERDERGW